MKRTRKRILAAALAMAILITAPGTAVYVTESEWTERNSENETVQTADADTEEAEAEDIEAKH